jgi:hypothetical protein
MADSELDQRAQRFTARPLRHGDAVDDVFFEFPHRMKR